MREEWISRARVQRFPLIPWNASQNPSDSVFSGKSVSVAILPGSMWMAGLKLAADSTELGWDWLTRSIVLKRVPAQFTETDNGSIERLSRTTVDLPASSRYALASRCG